MINEQSKALGYIEQQLIGPRDGDKELIESVNPSDLYLLGRIHPIEVSDELPIDDNEKTHLITRGERDKEEYSYINIPIEGGYFLNKTVGFEYSKKEELYLKYISKQRIRWKKMKLESKKKEIAVDDEN